MKRYIEHPYFIRFLNNKVSKNLAEVVEAIDSGEADKLEEKATKKSVEFREKRFAKTLPTSKSVTRSKSSKKAKSKKKSGKKKSKFRNASSTSTNKESEE